MFSEEQDKDRSPSPDTGDICINVKGNAHLPLSPKAALGELWKRIFSDINIDPDNYLDQFSSTSFPWSFPLLGGSPPHPQVREKAMGTRLQFFKDFFRLIRCLKIYLHRFIINTSLNPIQIEIVHD